MDEEPVRKADPNDPFIALMAGFKAWGPSELKAQLALLVDSVVAEQPELSALEVALHLLTRELDAFLLFARMGHLDPPREDGKIEIAILQRKDADPIVDEKIRQTAEKWSAKKVGKLYPLVQTPVRPVAFSQEAGTVRIELPDHQVAEVDAANTLVDRLDGDPHRDTGRDPDCTDDLSCDARR